MIAPVCFAAFHSGSDSFASTHHGNRVTEDDERRKLALCVETAAEVWGNQ